MSSFTTFKFLNLSDDNVFYSNVQMEFDQTINRKEIAKLYFVRLNQGDEKEKIECTDGIYANELKFSYVWRSILVF